MDEPIDPIIYGAAVGLGYAGWENIGYVFNTNYVGELLDLSKMWEMVLVRVGPAFGHMGLGIIMGSLVSMNLFNQWDPFKRRLYIVLALMVPVILHGTHNHFAAIESYHVLTVLIIASILILYYHRREQNKKIKLGICGEHGGDPKSIYFCSKIGLDYVSCSPYRVPVARLSAAQAELKKNYISSFKSMAGAL